MATATRRTIFTSRGATTKMTTQNNNQGRSANGAANDGANGNVTTREVSSLEITNDDFNPPQTTVASTIEEQYNSEREHSRLRHWHESEYAAGLVECTWSDELEASRQRGCCCSDRHEMNQMFQEEMDPGCGCNYLSAVVCSRLGAGRIGNMAVLKERYVLVEADDDDDDDDTNEDVNQDGEGVVGQEQMDGFVEDEEDGLHKRNNSSHSNDGDKNNNATSAKSTKKRMIRKREIDLIVGPFWPMLIFITYPLIFGVSGLTLWKAIPGQPIYIQLGWATLTFLLIRALFNTGFRDPGIINRHKNPPPVNNDDVEEQVKRRIGFRWGNEEGPWRWSDQTQSYRPRNSMYCPDCKVIIEEFDHT